MSWDGKLEPVYTNPANIGSGTLTLPDGLWTPSDSKMLSTSMIPPTAGTQGTASISGKVMLARLEWSKTQTVSTLWCAIHTAGATLTAGQNVAGLYTGAGVLIPGSTTPDQSTAWLTTGPCKMNLATPLSVPADPTGGIYVGLLTVGTTPAFFRGTNAGTQYANWGLVAGTDALNYCYDASTGNTALPASVNLLTATAVNAIMVAVS